MAHEKIDPQLVAEFDAFVARAQLPVPPDRRDGLIEALMEMRAMFDILRRPLPPGDETAGVFDVQSVIRNI
jgi:hypothetical protein